MWKWFVLLFLYHQEMGACPDDYIFFNDKCFTLNSSCEYNVRLPFAEYEDIARNVCSSDCTLPIKKDPVLDVYEWWNEIPGNYGKLFTESPIGYGDTISVIFNTTTENFTYIAGFDSANQVCAYDAFLVNSDTSYCSFYDKICANNSDTRNTTNCHCLNPTGLYFCELDCGNETVFNDTICSQCDGLYQKYDEPKISMSLNYRENFMFISIKSLLKLLTLDKWKVYCFTDADHHQNDLIYRYDFNIDEIEEYYSREDEHFYIYPKKRRIGHYWCTGFDVINLKPIDSGRLIAEATKTDESFTMNITVVRNSSYPLTIHETVATQMETIANGTDITQVKFLNIYPANDTTNMTKLSYRLYFNNSNTNMSDILKLSSTLFEKLSAQNTTITVSSSYCLSTETTQPDGSTLTWPLTLLGMTTTPIQLCLTSEGKPVTRTCLGEYLYGTFWSVVAGSCEPNSGTLFGSANTVALHQLAYGETDDAVALHQLAFGETSDDVIDTLKRLTSGTHISVDAHFMSTAFENVIRRNVPFSLKRLIEAASAIMDVDPAVLREAQLILNATDRLLYNLDNVMSRSNCNSSDADLSTNEMFQIKTNNIIVQVSRVNTSITGAAVHRTNGELRVEAVRNNADIDTVALPDLQLAAFLTDKQLQRIRKLNHPNSQLVVIFFMHKALFNQRSDVKLVGPQVGIYVTGFEEPFMVDDIRVLIKPERRYRANMSCSSWKYGRNELWYNRKGAWASGKEALKIDETYYCKQRSLFHFGIIAGLEDTIVLSILAAIGCGLSMLGSLAVITTAIVYRTWRDKSGNKILLNFVLTNLLQNVVLAVSSGVDSYTDPISCLIVGALLHYSVGSQFIWMIIIGYLQYQRYVEVYYLVRTRFVLLSSVIAWILPTVPVMVVLSLKTDAYAQDDFCYLQNEFLYYAVFLPVSLTLIVNSSIFVLIVVNVCCKRNSFAHRDSISWLNLRLAILLFFIMGLYWIFGISARFLHWIALDYFFCVAASIQGIVIFLYFIVFNKMTRNFWLRQLKRSEMIATMHIWLQQRRKMGKIKLDKSNRRGLKMKLMNALKTKKMKSDEEKLT